MREKLPDDFQTAEFLLEHGQLDAIFHRKEMREKVGNNCEASCKGGDYKCLKIMAFEEPVVKLREKIEELKKLQQSRSRYER